MNSPTRAELFLQSLRSRTAGAHQKLESAPVSATVVAPSLTVSQYEYYLRLMYDVVFGAEALHPQLGTIISDLDARQKSHLIAADLAFINAAPPHYRPIFAGNYSPAFALGILYTVEGSSLGGRFILKNVVATLGFDGANGATYFNGFGSQTGRLWKHFLGELTAYEASEDCADEIIAGATFAFTSINEHFISQE